MRSEKSNLDVLQDELIQLGNRNPKVPRRDLDFLLTLAIRAADEAYRAGWDDSRLPGNKDVDR